MEVYTPREEKKNKNGEKEEGIQTSNNCQTTCRNVGGTPSSANLASSSENSKKYDKMEEIRTKNQDLSKAVKECTLVYAFENPSVSVLE